MNDREPDSLSPRERAAQDAVRALSRKRPDDAFRARLRHEFVSGRIGRRQGLPAARPWFAGPAVWVQVAAVVLAIALVSANHGPDWRVVSAAGAGRVFVGDQAFAASDTQRLAARLARGGAVRTEGAVALALVAPGMAAVTLAPGADVTLSASPNHWWARGMEVHVNTGNVYFSTGRAFHGAHLDVRTPHATVQAVGTSFAVLCEKLGTCVCVMEGHVRVGSAHEAPGEGVEVPHGMRRVMSGTAPPELLPILDDSVHHLHQQLAASKSLLGR